MASRAGSPNKNNVFRKLAGTDKDPAKYLIELMTSVGADPRERMQAAVTLMPYVHRKQPIDVDGELNAKGVFTVRISREWDTPEITQASIGSDEKPATLQCVAGTPEVWQDSTGPVRLDRQGI